jgi:hypothetical protein
MFTLRALEAFERSLNAPGLDGLTFEPAPAAQPLRIQGVSVSVQPTAHIRVKRIRGADLVGAIVVDLAKGIESKTEESKSRTTAGMLHSAALLHQYVTSALARDGALPSAEHCVIFHSYRQERTCSRPTTGGCCVTWRRFAETSRGDGLTLFRRRASIRGTPFIEIRTLPPIERLVIGPSVRLGPSQQRPGCRRYGKR